MGGIDPDGRSRERGNSDQYILCKKNLFSIMEKKKANTVN